LILNHYVDIPVYVRVLFIFFIENCFDLSGNVPGNKDSGFQPAEDEDDVTSSWHISASGKT